jgi:hypothetical protein
MPEYRIVNLHLRASLYYTGEDGLNYGTLGDGTADRAVSGEYLFGFEIDSGQYRSIEPESASFIGKPFFRGRLSPVQNGGQDPQGTFFALEAGRYLFMQSREPVGREGILDMALELQKEGLWEGFDLDRRLFLRYVFEDGCMVSQLWRPILEKRP